MKKKLLSANCCLPRWICAHKALKQHSLSNLVDTFMPSFKPASAEQGSSLFCGFRHFLIFFDKKRKKKKKKENLLTAKYYLLWWICAHKALKQHSLSNLLATFMPSFHTCFSIDFISPFSHITIYTYTVR